MSLAPVAGSPWTVDGQPNTVAFSPSGRLLATASVFSFKLSMFSVNGSTGALTQVPGSPFDGPSGAMSVAFSSSGDRLISNGEIYSVDPATGHLTVAESLASHGQTWGAFSPSGDLVATANVFPSPGSVSIFKYDPAGGAATPATVGKSLAVSGSRASISGLLHAGRLSLQVDAPVPGREQIVWQYTQHKRVVTVASGAETFKNPGNARLVIHLTAAGRALLGHASRIALTAVASFKPQHGRTVTARRQIHLHK